MHLDKGANPEVWDNSQKIAIVYAVAKGFVSIVEFLLNTGISIDERYGNDLTVMMWAAGYNNDVSPIDAAIMDQLLLDHETELDLQDYRGWSAMVIATNMGHSRVIDILNRAGANIRIESGKRQTAAKLARTKGQLDTLALSNSAGAN